MDGPKEEQPVIRTERLILRLADPFDEADCKEVLKIYNDPEAAQKSVSGIRTIADVQEKFKRHGPRAEFCTLAPPPRGMFFLMHLPSETSVGEEGNFVGQFHLSFRPEMNCPDFGYAVLAPYEGKGYATEGGKAALEYWRETIGVKEIFIGTAPDNVKSQRLAEKLGLVRGGSFDVIFGHPPNERRETGGVALILPGMNWIEGQTMKLTVVAEVEAPEQYEEPTQ